MLSRTQALYAASRALPLHEAVPAMPAVLQRHGHYGHYPAWLGQIEPGPFWDRISPRAYAQDLRLPALHIGGWYDGMLTGTLAGYRDLAGRPGVGPQRLVVGPWVHIPWASKVGEREFGAEAINTIDHLQLGWFDHWLKGIDTDLMDEKPVHLFAMGGGWRDFAQFPQPKPQEFHLTSHGRAGLDPRDGRLVAAPPSAAEDVIVYDPWRPTPSSGGHAASPLGPSDRRNVDARSDVMTYTTAPLPQDMHLAGEVSAMLFVAADQPSFDLSAVLSEVRPDGKVINLTEGYLRLDTPVASARISLRATCATIAAGSALRLSVAAGSFPAHPVNAGDGSPPAQTRLIDQRIITIVLQHGGPAPSRLFLPIVPPP